MTGLKPPDPRSLEGRLRAHALGFPDATEEFPWGERAIKVRGKVFLFLRAGGAGVSFAWIEESYRAVGPKRLVTALDATGETKQG